MKGRELTEIDEPALRRLPKVAAAFSQARSQAEQYRRALVRRIGEPPLELRSYVVVAVGLERMLGERVETS